MEKGTDHQSNHLLAEHGLRKTAFRKDVLSIFLLHKGKAITSTLIEDALGDYDRITLYRTLKSFEDKGLVHSTSDRVGNTRYALCSHHCDEEQHHDAHAHFHCDTCGNTTCLEDLPQKINQLIPQGYKVDDIQITFSGTCEACN